MAGIPQARNALTMTTMQIKNPDPESVPETVRTLHACRHSFAMNLLDHGADPTVIQAGLRHSTLGSTWTYLRGTRDVEKLRPLMGRTMKEAS